MTEIDTCPVCGGDGRIYTSVSSTSCPACRGSGRRNMNTGFHDVTKTKPSHHLPKHQQGKKKEKKTDPETPQGIGLAKEVKDANLSENDTTKLIRSIIDYENQKGQITKTFTRLLRKQLRALQ